MSAEPRMAVDEYLKSEKRSSVRHEYVDGALLARKNGTIVLLEKSFACLQILPRLEAAKSPSKTSKSAPRTRNTVIQM
jgi:hypothetical protein